MSEDIKVTTDEGAVLMQAVEEIRNIAEMKSADITALEKSTKSQLESFFDKAEEKNQKVTADLLEAKKREQALEEKLNDMEALISKPGNGKSEEVKSAQKAAFDSYVKHGEKISPDEIKLLQTNDNSDGGYLVEVDYVRDIIKGITEISPLRSLARVRQTTSNEMQIPTRTSLLDAGWVGENVQDTLADSDYGLEKIPVNKMQVTVPITQELLRDASFNMSSEINADVIERFAQVEGAAFINGLGTATQPQGILTNPGVGETNTGNASTLEADAFRKMPGDIISGYNLSWLFNRRTLSDIMVLKDQENRYLWTPGDGGLPNGAPFLLVGMPYTLAIDMPDVAAGTYPVALGDWFRGYTIVDNVNIQMIRDDFTQKRRGVVEFMFYKRVGGQVTLAESIRKMKVSA